MARVIISTGVTPSPLDNFPDKLDKLLKSEIKAVLREYKITVRRWKSKPTFKVIRRGNFVAIGTDNEIYQYVDKGTRPHLITARVAPTLAFYSRGFRAKTRPNTLSTRAGRKANSEFVRPQRVRHPGTDARNYSKLIRERSIKRLKRKTSKLLK